jgi:hypothetical protein
MRNGLHFGGRLPPGDKGISTQRRKGNAKPAEETGNRISLRLVFTFATLR